MFKLIIKERFLFTFSTIDSKIGHMNHFALKDIIKFPIEIILDQR
jgi:hypothetical protein